MTKYTQNQYQAPTVIKNSLQLNTTCTKWLSKIALILYIH